MSRHECANLQHSLKGFANSQLSLCLHKAIKYVCVLQQSSVVKIVDHGRQIIVFKIVDHS